ncbi:MAG: exodeoxyribonuclease VII small subunit [Candidatus Bipolaricaulia bacterium]
MEQGLTRLEEIVNALESDEVSLEESLTLFEEGVKLADMLKRKLNESELRVKQVMEEAGSFEWRDFEI